MTTTEYQKIIEMTAIYPREIGLAYCTMGLVGEAGEVANKVKKIYRDQDGHIVKENVDQLKGEIGDVLWYITALANEIGVSLEDIMEANYSKLIKRRETDTLGGSGDDREEQQDEPIKDGDTVACVSIDISEEYEGVTNWISMERIDVKVGDRFRVKRVITDNKGKWVELEGLWYSHPIDKFKKV